MSLFDMENMFGINDPLHILQHHLGTDQDPYDLLLGNKEFRNPGFLNEIAIEGKKDTDKEELITCKLPEDIITKLITEKDKRKRKKKCQVCDKTPEEGLYQRKEMKFSICPSCRPMCAFKTCPMQEDLQLGEVGLLHNGFCSMHSRQFNKACTETSWAPQHPQRQHAHPFILPQLNQRSFFKVEQNIELACITEALQHIDMLSTWDATDIDHQQWTRIMKMVHDRAENIALRNGYQNIKTLPVVVGMSLDNSSDKKKNNIIINPHIDVENARIVSIFANRNKNDSSVLRTNVFFHVELLDSSNLDMNDIFHDDKINIDKVMVGHVAIRSMAHTQRYHVPLMPCDSSGKIGFGIPRSEHLTHKSWEFRNFNYFRQAPVLCPEKNISKHDDKNQSLIFSNIEERHEYNNNSIIQDTVEINSNGARNQMKNNFRKNFVAGSDTIKQTRRKRVLKVNADTKQIIPRKRRKKHKNSTNINENDRSLDKFNTSCSVKFDLSKHEFRSKSSSWIIRKCSIKLQTNMAVGVLGGFMLNSASTFWSKLPKKKKNNMMNGSKIKELLIARKKALLNKKLTDYTYVIL